LLVIYDDLDIASGVVRLRAKGGHGGHNGMRSIMAHLQGNKDFPRLRIGIGRPEGSMGIADYVLQVDAWIDTSG
jgi:PTH1 family peptidyl-tRNA hydrolase